MKRFLLTSPVLLLIFLNSCGSPVVTDHSGTETAVAETAIAIPPTSSIAATMDSQASQIVNELNSAIAGFESRDKFVELDRMIGASYYVDDVELLVKDNIPDVFEVDIRCECARNASCCSSQRTFVVAMLAMDAKKDTLQSIVPDNVRTMNVKCFDHANLSAVMTVPWDAVKNFLFYNGNVYQFASQVVQK